MKQRNSASTGGLRAGCPVARGVEGRLVPFGDAALASGLAELASASELRTHMGGRARGLLACSLDRMVYQYEMLLGAVAAQAQAG